MSPALLDASDLTIAYGTRGLRLRRPSPVVRDVSFRVAEGEALALVGESGSGKTTVARAVVGLHDPTSGRLTFAGSPLPGRSRPQALRREIQMVFQDPRSSLNPRMTVARTVAEGWSAHPGARPDGAERDAVAALLADVGLDTDVMDRRPAQLSGGQCQRVSIARALAVGPRLLVCDEAVSALDVSVQAQILRLLVDLKRGRRLALLFITHDLGVVRQIADRVAVMSDGALVEDGDTEDVFTRPRHPYTRELLDSALDLALGDTRQDVQ